MRAREDGWPVDPTGLPDELEVSGFSGTLVDMFRYGEFWIVTDSVRDIIEDLEPGLHQLHSVLVRSRRGIDLGRHWIVHWLGSLDVIDEVNSTYRFTGSLWTPLFDEGKKDLVFREDVKLVFSESKSVGHHFWRVRHHNGGRHHMCSQTAADRLRQAKITGVVLKSEETV
jgi:hypothetical protein